MFQMLIFLCDLTFVNDVFICRDVLPNIIDVLRTFSTESYLKDKGSAYRYSQGYKLQLVMLNNLGMLMAYLCVQEDWLTKFSEAAFNYLSDKQPVTLQVRKGLLHNFFTLK